MSLLEKIIRKIKHILSPPHQVVYPFVFHDKTNNVSFNINNSIEEFRLKDWGDEQASTEDMIKDLNEDDTFYDIGSSVGLVSVLAAKKLSKGKVISFEPDPENASKLEKNYQINKLTNFVIQQIAVGEDSGEMKLYTSGSNGFSPSLQKVNGIDHTIDVRIESIDNLIKNNLIPYPTVVKIDIEGAEMMALKGMETLLKSKSRPRLIFIELHPGFLPAFRTTTEEIFAFLNKFDYTIVENIERNKQILCKLVKNN